MRATPSPRGAPPCATVLRRRAYSTIYVHYREKPEGGLTFRVRWEKRGGRARCGIDTIGKVKRKFKGGRRKAEGGARAEEEWRRTERGRCDDTPRPRRAVDNYLRVSAAFRLPPSAFVTLPLHNGDGIRCYNANGNTGCGDCDLWELPACHKRRRLSGRNGAPGAVAGLPVPRPVVS